MRQNLCSNLTFASRCFPSAILASNRKPKTLAPRHDGLTTHLMKMHPDFHVYPLPDMCEGNVGWEAITGQVEQSVSPQIAGFANERTQQGPRLSYDTSKAHR